MSSGCIETYKGEGDDQAPLESIKINTFQTPNPVPEIFNIVKVNNFVILPVDNKNPVKATRVPNLQIFLTASIRKDGKITNMSFIGKVNKKLTIEFDSQDENEVIRD